MHRVSLLFFLLAFALPAQADDEDPHKPRADGKAAASERVWEGYLWKDQKGRLRIGWPVIAMGVMATPQHVIDVPDAKRFEPFLTASSDYYIFWNYRLEEDFAKCLPKLPKVLVRVRGRVEVTGASKRGGHSFGDGTHTMRKPSFLSVEFVSDAWLKAWAPVFREPWSPWRIRERPAGDKEAETKKLAPRLLETLRTMRKVAGATDAQKALAAKVAPGAKVVAWFREAKETDILRWLHTTATKHKLKLEGLAALGGVPPTGTELQRWFVAATDRDAFLKRVRQTWKGSLGALQLPYYEATPSGGITWTRAGLDLVADWTPALFGTNQKRTKETLLR